MPGAKNSLESYVDRVDEMDGSDYGDTSDVDTSTDNGDGGGTHGADDSVGGDRGDAAHSGGRNADDPLVRESKRQTPQGEAQNKKPDAQTQEDLRPLPNGLLQDKHGNLIHPQTKAIIAHAGLERRLHEKASRLEVAVRQKDTQIADLTRRLEDTTALNGMPKQLGISDEDLKVGLPIVAEFVKDPLNAAKKIVEMVVAMGHNVSDILGQGTDTIEMRALNRMIDERLAPVRELQNERKSANNAEVDNTRAQEAVRNFFDTHENAEMHADVINNLLGQRWTGGDESYTPEKAYTDLRIWCAEQGLDFNKPLAPQIQERQARQPNNGNSTVDQTRQPQRSMPNGRSSPGRTMEDVEMHNATDSWDDIVRSALR